MFEPCIRQRWRQKARPLTAYCFAPPPRRLYVEAQERHVRALLEAALAQRNTQLEALRRAQQQSEECEVGIHGCAGWASWWTGGEMHVEKVMPIALPVGSQS